MYIQHFHNFRTDDINHNKRVITNTIYGENKYLYQINSPKTQIVREKVDIEVTGEKELK